MAWPDWEKSTFLGSSLTSVMGILWLGCGLPAAQAQLTTALEVRSLNAEAAEIGEAVDLTGIVIFSDPPTTVFVQDETAGTFFRLEGATPPEPGDEVRVRGLTFPGLYLTGIDETTFEILGHPGLPEATPATHDDLSSGRYHYQRVAIEGIVRTIAPDEEASSLVRVAMGSRVVEIRVAQPPPLDENELIDSRVRISGLAAGHINDRRQLVEPYLRCADWADFEILKPAPNSEAVPAASPEQLLNFNVSGQGGHRVRVEGTVLANFPRGELFLRHEAASIGIRLLSPDGSIKAGDHLAVMGFPEMERFSASVVDASVIDRIPGISQPEPVATSISELMKGSEDGNLVSVSAAVSDWYRAGTGSVLVLQDDGRTIQARTPTLPDALSAGALIQVTGICQVESTRDLQYRAEPESVSLRLRSGADLVLLRAPSWWTAQRLAILLIVLVVAMLLAALWITLLRRQVIRQTAALRHRIETAAALEERQRIAREFHDTLEQELAGLSLRLDAASARGSDEKLRGFLEGSRSLVSRIQTETRNLVSDLRDSSGENAHLETTLRDLVNQHPVNVSPTLRLMIDPSFSLPPLPSRTAHHLKMIAQEAVTNALKHAQASAIELALAVDAETRELVMRISDDGRGFDVATETLGKSGHFGCMGIRERALKLNATVNWQSQIDEGSTLEVRMPLPGKTD